MPQRTPVTPALLVLVVLLSLTTTGASAPHVQKTFVLDSTASTYPFVLRLEGRIAQRHNILEITVEKGLVHSAIPEDTGSEGLATNIQVTVGLGRNTENGWTLDIEAPEQFIAMKLTPGETQTISRRIFVIKNVRNIDLASRWLAARLTVKQALPGVQPGLLSSYACSEENLLGATPASRERSEKMRSAYSHTC